MSNNPLFKISFFSHGKIYEVFARSIGEAALHGFIEVSDFVFGNQSDLVVDPAEERLKNEFQDVKSTYIPMHTIYRIDEVEKEGVSKIKEVSGKLDNVTPFPTSVYSPEPVRD